MPDWLTLPDWLANALHSGPEVPLEQMLGRLALAFALGCAIAVIYWTTHRRDQPPDPTFGTTVVLLAILMAVVTQVIGNNTARAFSLVGALSVVRFRTVVEDTRDTAFVIFAVVVGMAVGAGHPQMALVGLAVAGTAAALVRPRSRDGDGVWNLSVRVAAAASPEAPLQEMFQKHLSHVRLVATATSRQGSAFDLTYHVRLRGGHTAAAFASELNLVAGLQNVEMRRL